MMMKGGRGKYGDKENLLHFDMKMNVGIKNVTNVGEGKKENER